MCSYTVSVYTQRVLASTAAALLVLAAVTGCHSADSPATPHITQQSETTGLPDNITHAIRVGLSLRPDEYVHRAQLAQHLAAETAQLRGQTVGVELPWITTDGTPVIGVSTPSARASATAAGWKAQTVPPIVDTTRTYNQFLAWLAAQDPSTRDSVVMSWPDFVRGGVNVARDSRINPFDAPAYPPEMRVRERLGIRPPASTALPPAPAATTLSPLHPGDSFTARDSRCTLGPLLGNTFVTVAHCAKEKAPTSADGTSLGSFAAAGPTPETRTITPSTPAETSIRVDETMTAVDSTPTSAVIGAPICKAGRSSRWQCGSIVGLLPDNGFISTACSLSGDSGGPAIQGVAPVGVTDVSSTASQSQCPPTGDARYLTYTLHRTLLASLTPAAPPT